MQEAIITHTFNSKVNKAKNMFKVDTQAGNACIFMCFVMLNFCIFLSSLGMLGADIYLFVQIGSTSFTWIFLALGLALLVCSLASFKLRKSLNLLGIYLLILFGIFFFQLIATILMLINKDALIDNVWKASGRDPSELISFKETLNSHIQAVSVAMIVFAVVLVSPFL